METLDPEKPSRKGNPDRDEVVDGWQPTDPAIDASR
jgi:hypothetical protein